MVGLGEHDLGFGAKRTPAIKPPHPTPAAPRWSGSVVHVEAGEGVSILECVLRRQFQCWGESRIRRQIARLRADKAERERLRALCDATENRRGYILRRRLGYDNNVIGAAVRFERIKRHQCRDPTDIPCEITPTNPNGLGYAPAGRCNQAGHFLDTGPRRADDGNVAPRDSIGESQRYSVYDRRSAIRPHYQTTELPRLALEGNFVGERDIVAEYHHVQAPADGLSRLRHRELAGNGNKRQIRVGLTGNRRPNAPRPPCHSRSAVARRLFDEAFGFIEGRLSGLRILGTHADDQVAARGTAGIRSQQTGIGHNLPICRRSHHHGCFNDAVHFHECFRVAHQSHRIEVAGLPNVVDQYHFHDTPNSSANARNACTKQPMGAFTTPAPICPMPGSLWAIPVFMVGAMPVSTTRRISIPVGTPR